MKIVAGDQSKLKNLRKLISVLLFIPKVILMGNLFCHKWEKNLTRQRANRVGTISRILSYEDTTMPFLQQMQYPHRKLLQTNLNIINKEQIRFSLLQIDLDTFHEPFLRPFFVFLIISNFLIYIETKLFKEFTVNIA